MSTARAGSRYSAASAYDVLAPFYDRFTAGYAHDAWLRNIEAWAKKKGLRGRRLLDVACGTGKSFEPFVSRGYVITGCDISEGMVACARTRATSRVRLRVADMRALPWSSSFDIVICLNDAINYLVTAEDLRSALRSIANSLVPGGIAIFDANSLRTYRTTFASEFSIDHADCSFSWRGEGSEDMRPGGLANASLDIYAGNETHRTRHVQRHWPVARLTEACRQAGFERIEFRGQAPGGCLEGDPDESRHIKVMCLAVKPARMGSGSRERSRGGYFSSTSGPGGAKQRLVSTNGGGNR